MRPLTGRSCSTAFCAPAKSVSSQRIGTCAMEKLKTVDEVAYVRFASVYRQFKDINSFMEELSKIISSKQGG